MPYSRYGNETHPASITDNVTVGGPKMAYPPLLAPGRHVMTLSELKALTVDAFPSSTERPRIFAELERLANDISTRRLVAEIWVDGSFLSRKITPEPDDIDLSFTIDIADLETRDSAVKFFVMNTLNGGRRYSALLDTYICVLFPIGDPRRSASMERYWAEKWGIGWDDRLKGFAVVRFR
jgi:hypothetical protein